MKEQEKALINGRMIIITGWRGAGKTTFCKGIVTLAEQTDWQTGGLLSHAVFESGQKNAIEVEDLKSKKRRILARANKDNKCNTEKMCAGHWVFDQNILLWGNRILSEALPCDLFVVDELGPLEMIHGEGWTAGLTALDSGAYRLALVVIRPELLETAQQRWQQAEVLTIDSVAAVQAFQTELAQRFFSD